MGEDFDVDAALREACERLGDQDVVAALKEAEKENAGGCAGESSFLSLESLSDTTDFVAKLLDRADADADVPSGDERARAASDGLQTAVTAQMSGMQLDSAGCDVEMGDANAPAPASSAAAPTTSTAGANAKVELASLTQQELLTNVGLVGYGFRRGPVNAYPEPFDVSISEIYPKVFVSSCDLATSKEIGKEIEVPGQELQRQQGEKEGAGGGFKRVVDGVLPTIKTVAPAVMGMCNTPAPAAPSESQSAEGKQAAREAETAHRERQQRGTALFANLGKMTDLVTSVMMRDAIAPVPRDYEAMLTAGVVSLLGSMAGVPVGVAGGGQGQGQTLPAQTQTQTMHYAQKVQVKNKIFMKALFAKTNTSGDIEDLALLRSRGLGLDKLPDWTRGTLRDLQMSLMTKMRLHAFETYAPYLRAFGRKFFVQGGVLKALAGINSEQERRKKQDLLASIGEATSHVQALFTGDNHPNFYLACMLALFTDVNELMVDGKAAAAAGE